MAREATCLIPAGTFLEMGLVAQTSGTHCCWGCCSALRKPQGWLLIPHRKPQRGNKARCNESTGVTPCRVPTLSPRAASSNPPPPWQVTSPLPVPSGYPLSEKAARPSPSPGSCTKPPTPWRWPSPGGGEGSRGGVGGCHCARSTGLPGARRPTAWGLWGYGASVRRGSAGGQEAALMSARC